MCRYLRPDLLADAGIKHFDAWAATFGETVTADRDGPDRRRELPHQDPVRPVPERPGDAAHLARVRRRQDRRGPRPARARRSSRAPTASARPRPSSSPPRPRVPAYLQTLADAGRARPQPRRSSPSEDNMLKITSDGRKAALDMRLVDRRAAERRHLQARAWPPTTSPASTRSRASVAYRIPGSDQRHPAPGALQIVFCDLSTPNPRALERLRRAAPAAGRPRHTRRAGALHPRGPQRRREGPAVRGVPRRSGGGAGRLHGEDGRRHQHPGAGGRPAPPRLPVAPGRYRAARRPHPAPGQPEPGDPDLPLRRRGQL